MWGGLRGHSELESLVLVSGGMDLEVEKRRERMRYRLGKQNTKRGGKKPGNLLIPVKLVIWQSGGLLHVPGKEAVKENEPASKWREM